MENMSEAVHNAFIDCLFREGEDTANHVKVEGLTHVFGLHPQRLEEKREVVTAILAELPSEFEEGWSFLNICIKKNGTQWTGLHMICEELVIMSLGLGLMEYTFPREIWNSLPGRVPYLTVLKKK